MSIKNYSSKLNDIIQLPQFEKVQLERKSEKHTTLKEEERIVTALKKLKESSKVSESIYNILKPTGSQPPMLYGLAKIHKQRVPVRPVLSIPGSAYSVSYTHLTLPTIYSV